MTQVGENKIGFFYVKDKDTFCEIGGTYTVKNSSSFATTATGHVVLLLDKEDNILDIDDIPCQEAFDKCGGNFVGFVRSENSCGFVVGEASFPLIDIDSFQGGKVSTLKVFSEDFILKVSLDMEHTFFESDLVNGVLLLIYLDDKPKVSKQNKEVSLFSASVKIEKMYQ